MTEKLQVTDEFKPLLLMSCYSAKMVSFLISNMCGNKHQQDEYSFWITYHEIKLSFILLVMLGTVKGEAVTLYRERVRREVKGSWLQLTFQ